MKIKELILRNLVKKCEVKYFEPKKLEIKPIKIKNLAIKPLKIKFI